MHVSSLEDLSVIPPRCMNHLPTGFYLLHTLCIKCLYVACVCFSFRLIPQPTTSVFNHRHPWEYSCARFHSEPPSPRVAVNESKLTQVTHLTRHGPHHLTVEGWRDVTVRSCIRLPIRQNVIFLRRRRFHPQPTLCARNIRYCVLTMRDELGLTSTYSVNDALGQHLSVTSLPFPSPFLEGSFCLGSNSNPSYL